LSPTSLVARRPRSGGRHETSLCSARVISDKQTAPYPAKEDAVGSPAIYTGRRTSLKISFASTGECRWTCER
jgi:hypothetical protein